MPLPTRQNNTESGTGKMYNFARHEWMEKSAGIWDGWGKGGHLENEYWWCTIYSILFWLGQLLLIFIGDYIIIVRMTFSTIQAEHINAQNAMRASGREPNSTGHRCALWSTINHMTYIVWVVLMNYIDLISGLWESCVCVVEWMWVCLMVPPKTKISNVLRLHKQTNDTMITLNGRKRNMPAFQMFTISIKCRWKLFLTFV